MAQLARTFDATSYDTEQRDHENVPNGVYKLEISASDVAATSAGNGTILKTTIDVVEPEQFKGRKIFQTYNLENANAQAQEIGQRQFASLCRAIGADAVNDSEELHFRTFTAKVGLGKSSTNKSTGQTYDPRNEIKVYYFPDSGPVPEPSIDANQPAPAPKAANDNKPAAAAKAPPAQAAAGGQRRPWGQK